MRPPELTRTFLTAGLWGLTLLEAIIYLGEISFHRSWRRLGLTARGWAEYARLPSSRPARGDLIGLRTALQGALDRATSPTRLTLAAIAVVSVAGVLSLLGRDSLLLAGLAGIGGWFGPVWLAARGRRARQKELMRDFPAVLDLLAVAAASGLALGQAMELVSTRHAGPFSSELRRALDETAAGVRLPVALKRMAGRTGLTVVRGFATAVEQAVTFGSPVARVLRLQAGAARMARRREIEATIASLPLKLSLCTVFFFLPAIFVFVILPNLLAFTNGRW